MDSELSKKTAVLSKAIYSNKTPNGFTKNKEFSDRRSKLYRDNLTGNNFSYGEEQILTT